MQLLSLAFISIFLGVLAGILQLAGYTVYFKKVFKKHIEPNAASWGIWAIGAVFESISYIFVTEDFIKNILPIICALSAIFFFIISIRYGFFSNPSRFEWLIVLLDIIILGIWWLTASAILANILFIVIAIISFIPIFIHVYRDPSREHALPWFIWSSAYFFMSLTVIIRWQEWEDLLYPIVFLLLHFLVAYFALDSRSARKPAII